MALQLLADRRPVWSGMVHNMEVPTSAVSAVIEAGLDNHVTKLPLVARAEDGREFPTNQFVLADLANARTFGGIVGPSYTYMQNMELAEMLDATLGERYPVTAVGQTPGGAGVFFLLDAGESEVGGDAVRSNFLVVEMRTGGFALKTAFGVFRLWCQNQLMTALSSASSLLVTRHDRQFVLRAEGATRFLRAAEQAQADSLAAMRRMAARPISQEEFQAMIGSVYPMPDRSRLTGAEAVSVEDPYFQSQVTRSRDTYDYLVQQARNRRSFAADLFDGFRGERPELRGTVWAAYNAVVEAEDHGYNPGASIRSIRESAMFGTRAATKADALAIATSLVMN